MKGIVFTEFLEMVENKFDANLVDDIIEASHLASEGAYTSVGTYDHQEIIELVKQLSTRVNTPIPVLIKTFGNHLFQRFYEIYPSFFVNIQDAFAFLASIETHVHFEVKKLYPEAELPSFDYVRVDNNMITLTYRSQRPFADLAEGLIEGCINHFGGNISLQRDALSDQPSNGGIKFTLIKHHAY